MINGARTVRFLSVLLAAAALLASGSCSGSAQPLRLENLSHFPRTALVIDAAGHDYRFHVWVADTAARQAQGLMFVRDLAPTEGMLFPIHPPRVAHFWMENTYIPLDMLFVAPNGRIEKIIENAKPFSLKSLSSGVPVEAVIEIGGGETRKLGLAVGQRVRWKKPTGGN